jgi:hypothetical protein
MAESGSRHEFEVDAIRDAAMIFAPRHLLRVLVKVFAADPVTLADFRGHSASD